MYMYTLFPVAYAMPEGGAEPQATCGFEALCPGVLSSVLKEEIMVQEKAQRGDKTMKQTVVFLGIFASVLILLPAKAADVPSATEEARSGANRDGERSFLSDHDGMGRRRDPRAEAEAQIREKFPAEYAEIEKLRAEAEAKLRDLAEKAGVEIPKTFAEQLLALKEKYPKEMAEIEELRKTDRMAANRKMRELAEKAGIALPVHRPGPAFGRMGEGTASGEEVPPPPPRVNRMRKLKQLRRKFPKEMAEIEELRRTDPAAAQTKMQELIKQLESGQTERP